MAWSIDDFGTKNNSEPNPRNYILDGPLESALRVAARLRLPLLLTGEPGTGKTQMAYKAAQIFAEMQGSTFLPKPLEFVTKTSSVARDLLYSYDAVRHFYDASRNAISPDEDYITLTALGQAIVHSLPEDQRGKFKTRADGRPRPELFSASARSSVVLIDEIDKAPRDFPNDLLHELDRFEFRIPEIRDSEVKFKRSMTKPSWSSSQAIRRRTCRRPFCAAVHSTIFRVRTLQGCRPSSRRIVKEIPARATRTPRNSSSANSCSR